MERPQETTELEKVEWLHINWKAKQLAVPKSPNDLFVFRSADGSEIKRTRQQLMRDDSWSDLGILVNEVRVTLGEAEQKAK